MMLARVLSAELLPDTRSRPMCEVPLVSTPRPMLGGCVSNVTFLVGHRISCDSIRQPEALPPSS